MIPSTFVVMVMGLRMFNSFLRTAMLAALMFFGALSNTSFCQLDQFVVSDPNPEDVLSAVNHLLNPSVAKEIGVTSEQTDALKHALDEAKGALAAFSMDERDTPANPDDFMSLATSAIELRRQMIQDLFDPMQLKRLKEVSYQIEIETKGFEGALIDGFTGKSIGVQDYELPALQRGIEAANRSLFGASQQRMLAAWRDYSEILKLSPKGKLESLLGKPRIIREGPYYAQDEVAVPDFRVVPKLLSLLDIPIFAESLEVDDAKSSNIRKHLQNYGSAKVMLERDRLRKNIDDVAFERESAKLEESFEKGIGREFLTNLKQFALQVEISRVGIAEAVQRGNLGRELGITESLSNEVGESLLKREEQLRRELSNLHLSSLSAIKLHLSPTSRKELERLLGKPFQFKQSSLYVVKPKKK